MLIEKLVPGSVWGKWTVVGEPFKEGKHAYVYAKCSCGENGKPRAYSLLNGSSKQCVRCRRAAQAEQLKVDGSGWNTYLYRYKSNAKNRMLEFHLTKEEFVKMCLSDCDYCGAEPRDRTMSPSQMVRANGIDRVDSARHYHLDNCVPCCDVCNKMKMNMTREEFLNQVARIRKHELKK